MAHGPSCSAACGIFLDWGTNLHPLDRQADSQPLCHQGNPKNHFFNDTATTEIYTLRLVGSVRCV